MRKFISIGLFIILFSLTGCSIAYTVYFRNLTEDTYVLKIYTNSETSQSNMIPNHVRFKNRVLEMHRKTWREMTDTLNTVIIRDTLIIEIPPKSTIQLPYHHFFYEENLEVEGLLLRNAKMIDSFEVYPNTPIEKFKRTFAFPSVISYYDIK